MDPNRQLMIKVKTCQRIRKEVDYYIKEVKENEAQLQAMIDDKKDPYDIKKFEEVLGESRMMVPDSQRRLTTAVQELQQFLAEATEEQIADDDEWKQAAVQFLENEKAHITLTKNNNDESPKTNVDDLTSGEAF